MPLVQRVVVPLKCSAGKLELTGKYECEFVAVNNEALVNVLRQLASLVTHAGDIFSETANLADLTARRIKTVKLRLEELEAKTELFEPKLVPVPEGSLEDVSVAPRFSRQIVLEERLFGRVSRPRFLTQLYEKAGSYFPAFPPRSPVATLERRNHNASYENRRPASFAALRDWKLDDYLDEKIKTMDGKKQSAQELNRALASPFPDQVVRVDVTGQGFDRMKRNRRSLVIHTKRIRRSKRRNTICGSLPNKECGIQTSFSSVHTADQAGGHKKYGIDSGHWSCTSSGQEGGNGPRSTVSAPSPWDPASLSTSSDFLFDDEDRCLTPQLEHLTDGLVSDTDSVDTDGYFTSFRSDCGFPKSKKAEAAIEEGEEGSSIKEKKEAGQEEDAEEDERKAEDSEYELFGKGSTSTTASSCTVVFRNKPNPPSRNEKDGNIECVRDDAGWEERVKRKSLIERVPSLVVVTPSPSSCSSASPPPLKDPSSMSEESDRDSGRITPKASDLSQATNLSDTELDFNTDTESELRTHSRSSSVESGNSTLTLTNESSTSKSLPQPDVIPDVQLIRTKVGGGLEMGLEYFSLDTLLLTSSPTEEDSKKEAAGESGKKGRQGARVVLDANGEILFASETLKRKRKPKVSFDPGAAVKTMDYDSLHSTYGRVRESVYDRIVKREGDGEKLYDTIEEIRRQNMSHSAPIFPKEVEEEEEEEEEANKENGRCSSSASSTRTTSSLAHKYATRPPMSPPVEGGDSPLNTSGGSNASSTLLETDLDSAIPPSMPDLKNLPKIKDRLKRNESYRMANPEAEAARKGGEERPTLLRLNLNGNCSPSSSLGGLGRRMSFASPKGENLHLNKKREILEEDPNFVEQVLRGRKGLSTNSSPPMSPRGTKVTLSKLALSPEDKPSFLRRDSHDSDGHDPLSADSPPTMDEIAKEIYRFRKKFGIESNPSSKNVLLERGGRVRNSFAGTTSTTPSRSTIPLGFPRLQKVQFSSPLQSSTPISANTRNLVTNTGSSVPPSPPVRTSSRKIFPSLFSPRRGAFSLAEPSPGSFPLAPRTSLSDFKKLLQAAKPKGSQISAMEALKPRVSSTP